MEQGKVVLCRTAQLRATWRYTVAIHYINNTYSIMMMPKRAANHLLMLFDSPGSCVA